ncbi:MAG TPA: TlpA disulfide reductase family protein [Jiangellales bacterium]|nr:TlpA disulfide reductase family protein [Jiangellales bacterium]
MRRPARLAAAAVALALSLAACSDGQVQRSDTSGDQTGFVAGTGVVTTLPAADREPAVDFAGPMLGGGDFDLADHRGDVVVLNVWGSWCAPCRKEAPALQAVHEATRDQGVQVVGVNTRDTESGARAFVEQFGLTFPSVVDASGARLLAFRDTLPPAAIPSTLVLDREGRVAARVLGEITETSLRDLVADVAGEPASGA